ncbi:retrovirus-related pol polyprotein from transposon TNT 1-94 [Tanacetum coccineum]
MVMEMARSMLYEKKLLKTFWAEAVATSVYLQNRLATKAVTGKTPIEAWSGTKPSIQHLKAFGSISYYRILDIKRSKLDVKARKDIFVGYATESKGYRIHDLTDSKIVISRDVTFDEGAYWDYNMDEVKRHEDTFLNETYHDEVDIPEFDIEDTTDTDVLRTRPLVDVYESCNSFIKPKSYMDASKHSEWIDAMKAVEMIKKKQHIEACRLAKRAKCNRRSSSESTLYMNQFNSIERLIIYLYVDDLLVIGSNNHLVKEFKKQTESEFDISDMGLVSYFIGMEIKQLPNGVHISQRKYASDMLKKFKIETNGEDVVEHIGNFLEIIDLLNVPNTRGDDQEVITDDELPNLGDGNLTEEYEISQIFRIDTDIFHFETPLSEAFKEFNCLLKIDVDVLTNDILGFKTYDEYKDVWIYEWNKDIPWVANMPWLDYGPWMEPSDDIKHIYKSFCFKNGHAKWPTCNWKMEKYCNGGDLPGVIRNADAIYFEIYELYENLEEGTNNDYETQENEGWFYEHELIGDDSDDIGDLEGYLI